MSIFQDQIEHKLYMYLNAINLFKFRFPSKEGQIPLFVQYAWMKCSIAK
jgi:hypothetical protein